MKEDPHRADEATPNARASDRGLQLAVRWTPLALALAAPMVCLTLFNVAWQLSRVGAPDRAQPAGWIRFLNLDGERNLATWYSSSLLLLSCVLLAAICVATRTSGGAYAWHWGILSLTFAFLSLDEAVALHERTMVPLRAMLDTSGWLYWAWVIPGSALVVLYGLAYLPFLAHLPGRSRRLFLLAGLLYVGGVLGAEIVSGQVHELYGSRSLAFGLVTTLEETLEMLGALTFIYALAHYIGRRWGGVGLRFARD